MKSSNERIIIDPNNTNNFSCGTRKKLFYDECSVLKTDALEEYYTWIALVPKNKSSLGRFNKIPEINELIRTKSDILYLIIKSFLAKATSVKKIFFLERDNVIHIWILISGYGNEAKRKLVYNREAALCNFLSKSELHFDFLLIDSDEVEEILSLGVHTLYDRTKS